MTRSTRQQIEDWIERLISMLDEIDGDAELEADPDREPEYRDNHLPDGLGYLPVLQPGMDWPPQKMASTKRIRGRRCTAARSGAFVGPDGQRYVGWVP